jgi:serine/threonine-protein kinase
MAMAPAQALGRSGYVGDPRLVPGALIAARYRIEGLIGSGGMGAVLSGFDTQLGQRVAIKVLLPRRMDEIAVQRFFREARATQRIQSPFVVRVLDAGVDGERPYIVMEQLEGQDLGARLKVRGRLSLQEVADSMLQVCEALANAHGAGVVHRDLKPSNLFQEQRQDGHFRVRVLDFGISKSAIKEDWEVTLTQTGDGLLGSPPYMSPEQIRNARTVDHRSDIWSMGVVAYRLLCGKHPYEGETVGEIFSRILERKFPELSRLPFGIPQEVDQVIARCLTHERAQRYQNVAELALGWAPFASPGMRGLVSHIQSLAAQHPPHFPEAAASLPDVGLDETATQVMAQAGNVPVDRSGSLPQGSLTGASATFQVDRAGRVQRALFALSLLAVICAAIALGAAIIVRGREDAQAPGASTGSSTASPGASRTAPPPTSGGTQTGAANTTGGAGTAGVPVGTGVSSHGSGLTASTGMPRAHHPPIQPPSTVSGSSTSKGPKRPGDQGLHPSPYGQ